MSCSCKHTQLTMIIFLSSSLNTLDQSRTCRFTNIKRQMTQKKKTHCSGNACLVAAPVDLRQLVLQLLGPQALRITDAASPEVLTFITFIILDILKFFSTERVFNWTLLVFCAILSSVLKTTAATAI